jgi:hypothetical protein
MYGVGTRSRPVLLRLSLNCFLLLSLLLQYPMYTLGTSLNFDTNLDLHLHLRMLLSLFLFLRLHMHQDLT